MLCAPLATRERVLGLLKIAARHPGSFGSYEAELVGQFLPHASIALQNSQRTESLELNLIQAERKHAMADLARGVAHDVNNALGAVLPLVQRCAISGVKLAIENGPSASPEDFNRLFSMLARSAPRGEPAVGMCLDVGHANLHSGTRNDYIGYLDRLRPDLPIIHLHLHENNGESDSHMVIFTGAAGRDPRRKVRLCENLNEFLRLVEAASRLPGGDLEA